MHTKLAILGLYAALCMGAAAQTGTNVTTVNGGTQNQVPKMSGSSTIVDSAITENGGKVGINNTNPTEEFTVTGGAGTTLSLSTSGEPALKLYRWTGGGSNYYPWYFGTSGSDLYIQSGAGAAIGSESVSPFLTIKSSGNVGIGTTSPAVKLEVNGGIKLSTGSGGIITFPDGSTLNSAATLDALGLSSTFSGNTGVGFQSLYANTTGSYDVGFGQQALFSNSTGIQDAALGSNALWGNVSGSNDTAVGQNAMAPLAAGDGNTAVGSFSGLIWGPVTNATLTSSIFIGVASWAAADGDNNEIVIGNSVIGAGSNSVTLGNPAITKTLLQGNVGIGTATPAAKLEVNGSIKLTDGSGGSIVFPGNGGTQTVAWNGTTFGGDYAESVDVIGDRKAYEPGDVMVIDPDSPDKFLKASEPYSTMVAGIYSTKPGLTGRRQKAISATWQQDEVPMAMMGIVPTKVSAENGAIKPGDLMVASSTPGYAMKGTDRERLTGAVLGKAMGHLDSGKGVIEVLVSLQ